MEPENTADYSKESYWSQRYANEPTYDWFATVYPSCVDKLSKELSHLLQRKLSNQPQSDDDDEGARHEDHLTVVVRVLHLGCGNSQLCRDLAKRWQHIVANQQQQLTEIAEEKRPRRFVLRQVAVDYSPVVVENMRESHMDLAVGAADGGASRSSSSESEAVAVNEVEWFVGDIRDLSPLFPQEHKQDSSCPTLPPQRFDLIIDKGTMDAIQADKDSDYLDEDLDAMLKEVSRLLQSVSGVFVQITWEIPYYRLHITKQDHYIWRVVENSLLGESDMYRYFRYTQGTGSSSSS